MVLCDLTSSVSSIEWLKFADFLKKNIFETTILKQGLYLRYKIENHLENKIN